MTNQTNPRLLTDISRRQETLMTVRSYVALVRYWLSIGYQHGKAGGRFRDLL